MTRTVLTEILAVYPSQSSAMTDMRGLATTAREIDVLAVQALLLDPGCEAARQRAAEIGAGLESFTSGIRLSITRLRELNEHTGTVCCHLYTMSPTWRVISLDGTMFVSGFGAPHLRSYILGYQGLVARAQGQPESALGLFDEARQTAGRAVCDPTRSWLTVWAADALARVGRSREALAALYTARSLLAGQDSRRDEWMYDFDEGSLAIHAGTCPAAIDERARALGAVPM